MLLTVPPTLGIVGAFWAHARKRSGWLIAFALLASLKPQLGFLPLFYLFVNGAHRELSIAGLIAVLVGVVSMLPSGLGRVPSDVAHCYALHMQIEFNSPSHFFNLPSLFAAEARKPAAETTVAAQQARPHASRDRDLARVIIGPR